MPRRIYTAGREVEVSFNSRPRILARVCVIHVEKQSLNELVRYSRAGDKFHYRWAARRCLRMIDPLSPVRCITIEGSKESKAAGEYVIDVAEYSSVSEDSLSVAYFQLKHSTKRTKAPFSL